VVQLNVLSALKWTHSQTNDQTTSLAAGLHRGPTVCVISHRPIPMKPC